MNALAAARDELAGELTAALPGWNVYGTPPPSPVTPCVIVAPADPYGKQVGHGGRWELTFTVVALTSVRAAGTALADLEEASAAVIAGVSGVTELSEPSVYTFSADPWHGVELTVSRHVIVTAPAP